MIWKPTIDPASIPDEILLSEFNRRRSARRQTFAGQAKVIRPCPTCGQSFSARELRAHRCPNRVDRRRKVVA